MTFGVTSSGFNLKRFTDIRESLIARANLKPKLIALDTDPETVFGELIDIMAGEFSDYWELAQAVSQLTNPESAEGVLLDNAGALVGVERQEAAPTTTYIRFIGDDNTTITTDVEVSVPGEDKSFSPLVDITLSGTQPVSYVRIKFTSVSGATAYSLNIDGNTITYDGSPATTTVQEMATYMRNEINNASSVNGFVTATVPSSDDDTLIIACDVPARNFQFTNLATAYSSDEKYGISLNCECTRNGPVNVAVGEVSEITSTVTGLDSASNLSIGILGRNAETDEEFRLRRRQSLAIIGSGTIDSIVDNIDNIDGVTRTTGVENTTNSTDSGGRPGKSFEIIVTGGEDQEIAELIWRLKPAGIETYGLINGGSGVDVTDTSGNTQIVKFSRPVERAIAVRIEYQVYDEEEQPTNIQTAIDTAVLAYAETLIPGKDIIPQRFGNAVWNGVSGLQEVQAYVTVSADATSPSAPTGIAGEQAIVALDERDYGSLDQVDITYAVIP